MNKGILEHVSEKTVARTYGLIANDYDRHKHKNPNPWLLIERPSFKQLLGNLRGKRVLDVGCGTGILLKELVSKKQFKEAIGIDLSKEMLSVARRNNKNEKMKFALASMNKIPFKDGYFDLIISTNALDCVEDVEKVLKELFRTLKKRGKLIFSIRHPVRNSIYIKKGGGSSYFERGWHKEKWQGTGGKLVYRFYRTLEEWTSALLFCGFHIKMLLELKPEKRVAKKYPRFYKKYYSNPRILMFALEKGDI